MVRRSRRVAAAAAIAIAVTLVSLVLLKGAASPAAPVAAVRRGPLAITLTESGVLRPETATVYRSPIEGRELEITYLAPEGSQVRAGDVLARLDTSALQAELDRADQALREAEMELQAADVDRREAEVSVNAASHGAGALAVEEARTATDLSSAKAARLREAHAGLQPLLDKGYITREEWDRSASDLEEAEAAAALARRKLQLLVERTQPDEQQTARLQLARRVVQLDHLRPKVEQARAYRVAVAAGIASCTIRARAPGLVMYEDNLFVTPRRRIRVGDRVTPSQGLVTLPDLRQMDVATSVRESDVHFIAAGQRTRVWVDAFPDTPLAGTLTRVGAVAASASDGPSPERRFAVTVQLAPSELELRPDMAVRVDIAAGERRDVLLVPAGAIFARDGVPTCYVAHATGVEPRMVQAGASNDRDVEIIAGLRAGERVLLSDPHASR
jgi:multidrug efflux pump subunit AcrA (membrane-fusion protein)